MVYRFDVFAFLKCISHNLQKMPDSLTYLNLNFHNCPHLLATVACICPDIRPVRFYEKRALLALRAPSPMSMQPQRRSSNAACRDGEYLQAVGKSPEDKLKKNQLNNILGEFFVVLQ